MKKFIGFQLLALAFFSLVGFDAPSEVADKVKELRKSAEKALMQIPDSKCTAQIRFEGAIGAGTLDYLGKGIQRAQATGCGSILLLINTPGGSLQSTRMIVEDILNSPIPFLCLVHPSGGHAGSAGAIILQACHVVGAMESTNIGAATPILGTGQSMADDLRKKVINDTVSWVEGLAKRRGRSQKFAKDIVTEAKAVGAQKALKLNAIDFVGNTVDEFLAFAQGREVKMAEGATTKVVVGPLRSVESGIRYKVLQLIGDPQFAYLLFMGSLGLLYFEITHPGTIVPGVVGGLGLVLSLVSFHKLDVWYGGLALMLLGLLLLIAEAFVPSFGALGIGGIVAFVLGSIFLFDAETTGFSLPLSTILPTALAMGGFMLWVAYMAFHTRTIRRAIGKEDIVGRVGEVVSLKDDGLSGQVEIQGEIWRFVSDAKTQVGKSVRVRKFKSLTVHVTPLREE